jgi:hypothetical protein
MDPGDYAIDTEDDDPDLAVVLECPEKPIDEVPVDGDEGRTVADDNPDYDTSEPAVRVAFVESGLSRHWEEWTEAAPDQLYQGAKATDVKVYTFPESRLSTVSEERATALLADATVDVDGLRARLEDARWDIELDDDGSLVAEKMGEQYRITPTGDIEGDGQVREPLENLVEQYIE